MITTGSKLFFGSAGVALAAGAVYPWTSGNERFGLTLLAAWAAAYVLIGAVAQAFRDANADAVARLVGADAVPVVLPPGTRTAWPVVAGFGAALVAIGVATEPALWVIGALVVGAAVFEWAFQAWADAATSDPAAARALRNRMLLPIEIPVGVALAAGVVVLSISRILLAVPELGAVIAAIAIATVIFVVAIALSLRPRVPASLVAAILLVGGLAIVAGGVVAALAGERTIEPHHGEEIHDATDAGGAAPAGGTADDHSEEGQ